VKAALSESWLLENSLRSFAKLMFLHHASFLNLSINGKQIENLENPFNKVLASKTAKKWL